MKSIKDLLNDSKIRTICGAPNALIAKIIENHGFDGIWISSFEMHAIHRLPDASILNSTDYSHTINKISDRINIPILVDGDEGGPSSINTIRSVREYIKAGASGICIEDNPSPKRCSFYGMKKELENPDIMAGKLLAAIEKKIDPNFAVIARTEALIQKHGINVAMERARIYNDVGIDGFLIHSKSNGIREISEFAKKYHKIGFQAPLICVPTKYNQVTLKELEDLGFSLVIYANYSIRAIVKVLNDMFSDIKYNGTLSAGNKYVVPMAKIFDLIWVDELKENQERYGS